MSRFNRKSTKLFNNDQSNAPIELGYKRPQSHDPVALTNQIQPKSRQLFTRPNQESSHLAPPSPSFIPMDQNMDDYQNIGISHHGPRTTDSKIHMKDSGPASADKIGISLITQPSKRKRTSKSAGPNNSSNPANTNTTNTSLKPKERNQRLPGKEITHDNNASHADDDNTSPLSPLDFSPISMSPVQNNINKRLSTKQPRTSESADISNLNKSTSRRGMRGQNNPVSSLTRSYGSDDNATNTHGNNVSSSGNGTDDHLVQLNKMIKDITVNTTNKTKRKVEDAVNSGVHNINAVLDEAMQEEIDFLSQVHERKMEALRELYTTMTTWAQEVKDTQRQHQSQLKKLTHSLTEITQSASETIDDIDKSCNIHEFSRMRVHQTQQQSQVILDKLKEDIYKISSDKDTSTIDAIKAMLTLFQ